MKKYTQTPKIEPINVEDKLCPICKAFLDTIEDYGPTFGFKKCTSCGWTVDTKGNNLIINSLMEEGMGRQEALDHIRKNWSKIKGSE